MASKTADAYWLALCVIWQWGEKTGLPPKPIIFAQANPQKLTANPEIQAEPSFDKSEQISILPSLLEISRVLKTFRLDSGLSNEAVSIAAGLSPTTLTAIEMGKEKTLYIDIANLINYYTDTINPQESIHE
jgi:DNA-binding XRE family transcriptional regulator